MAEPRLKSKLRVQAMLRAATAHGAFAVILRRGDADAGGILIVLRTPDGLSVLSETRAGETLAWLRATGPAPVGQDQADAYTSRRTQTDPDLWMVEIETQDTTLPFEATVIGAI